MEKRPIKVAMEGPGYRYTLFEVRDTDVEKFLDEDKALILRHKFKEYLAIDKKRVEYGEKSGKIEFCTLVDTKKYRAEASITDGNSIMTYQISGFTEWHFIVSDTTNRHYVPHMPSGMPQDYTESVKSLLAQYIDNADETTIDTLNNEYITFFNLYTPEGKMLLCRRSRSNVRSEFTVMVDVDENADADRLSVLCRHAQGIEWNEGCRHREYDANSLIYDDRWYTGAVQYNNEGNVDYFVTGSDPTSIDARWFESWATI